MTWTTFRIVPGAGREAVCLALFAVGAQAVQEDGAALITSFPPGTDLVAVRSALKAADGTAMIATSDLPDIDWSEAWKARLTAHAVGGLTITPPWLAHEHDPAASIIIDPGMAFGTGDHPTTRGVLRLLRQFVRPGMVVADLGAGSAALAIAAAKLGAGRVAAVELDPDAIENAIENTVVNGVADRVQVIEGDALALLPLLAPVDLVLANIISSVLIPMLPGIAAALPAGGCAILSGLLVEEQPQMRRIFTDGGWREVAVDEEADWWSVAIQRP